MTACFDFKTEWKHTNIKFVMKMTNFTNTCKKYNSWWKWLMFICQCFNCISYSSSGSISWFFKKENIYMHELNVNQIWYVVFFHELLVDYKKILLWNVYIYIHVLVCILGCTHKLPHKYSFLTNVHKHWLIGFYWTCLQC